MALLMGHMQSQSINRASRNDAQSSILHFIIHFVYVVVAFFHIVTTF